MAAYIVLNNKEQYQFHVRNHLPITEDFLDDIDFVQVDGHEQTIVTDLFPSLPVERVMTLNGWKAKAYCQAFGNKYGFKSLERKIHVSQSEMITLLKQIVPGGRDSKSITFQFENGDKLPHSIKAEIILSDG